jgi:putative two-component system hydrogenase maturation factor HypX/HoxX
MRVLLVSSAFNSMTQRFYLELADNGYEVAIEVYSGNEDRLRDSVTNFRPDLIIAPFLTRAIPEDIWRNQICIIVHPGVEGDRGPSSLDWAIQEQWQFWGVTLLQAAAEMDAGPIWATRTFPLREATKSSVYRREVIEAAVDCLWEVIGKFGTAGFQPRELDYRRPGVVGRERPAMKQADRRIDWERQTTSEILARIHAADGVPGVLDQIGGAQVYLHNACSDMELGGNPGEVVAISSNGSICRATVDGAVWIGHAKLRHADGSGIKMPAVQALADFLPARLPMVDAGEAAFFDPHPTSEIRCEVIDEIGYLHFDFHNGAMSTSQCEQLRLAFSEVATSAVKIIVLMGGEDHWSNGIHLNQIEANSDPAAESWSNINAMDDLVHEVITTTEKIVIAALNNNAGAGGAILPLAADMVVCRDGVVLNPHYKNMGWLYGSEYWTYLLPKRIGWDRAIDMTETCLPISARRAKQIGLVDEVLQSDHKTFASDVRAFAMSKLKEFYYLRTKKRFRLQTDQERKPLSAYRNHELTQMYKNFYAPNSPYHSARRAFVKKQAACWSPLSVRMLSAIEGLSVEQADGGCAGLAQEQFWDKAAE